MATSKEAKQAEKEGAAAKPESAAELQEKIRAQVEYYLSRQNLLQDQYLISKMDKDHFVEISVIAEFKLIKQLTTDPELILASVRGSDQIIIDEGKKKIKPAIFHQRTTLILRNIPSNADKEEVETLLSGVAVPKILSLRAEVGDNWFATFETEDATKSALELVKGLKWQEKRISAAIKSENAIKSLAIGAGGPFTLPPSQLFIPAANVATNGDYMVPNGGQYSYPYAGSDGQGGFRSGGRGGFAARRGPGVGSGAPMNGAGLPDGGDNRRPAAAGKKKGRGLREGGGRDGGVDGMRGGAAGGASNGKETPQASIDLADFPILEAKNPNKKDSDNGSKTDARIKNPESSSDNQKRENPAANDGGFNDAAASPFNGSCDSQGPAAQAPPKKSYAQMALASANSSSGTNPASASVATTAANAARSSD